MTTLLEVSDVRKELDKLLTVQASYCGCTPVDGILASIERETASKLKKVLNIEIRYAIEEADELAGKRATMQQILNQLAENIANFEGYDGISLDVHTK